MKLSAPGRLRRPILAAAIALCAAAALLAWSHTERFAAETMLKQEDTRLNQARSNHLEAQRTDTETRHALRQLDALRNAGLLTPPDRHAWQTHLLAVQNAFGLDKLDWEISPLQPLEDKETAAIGQPESTARAATNLIGATLKLRGTIAHEEQLLHLLERPPTARQGLFIPRSCRISRILADTATSALAVDCEIDWISLRLPDSAR